MLLLFFQQADLIHHPDYLPLLTPALQENGFVGR
jgi:hypothetical protein